MLEDFCQTNYIFPAIYCANKCIESQAYFAYLTTHLDLLFGEDLVTHPLNAPSSFFPTDERPVTAGQSKFTNDQIQHWFAHPSGLFDVNAIAFILCLETIKDGLTDVFKSIYSQSLFNHKVSTFLLVWACRYAQSCICEAILTLRPEVVVQCRNPVTFVTGEFPIKGTYTLMPNTYGQYTPHQALSLHKGDDLAMIAVRYLLQRHGIFDSAVGDLLIHCRHGEWASLGADQTNLLPKLKLRATNGSVDLSQMISAASVVVIQDFLRNVPSPSVWQYKEVITYSTALELKDFLYEFGVASADLPEQKLAELEGAIKWLMNRRQLFGLNDCTDETETRLTGINNALALEYGSDFQRQLADMFFKRTFLPIQRSIETTLLRLLSTNEAIHFILTTCRAFETPVVIRSMLFLTTTDMKNLWDVSSLMVSLLHFARPSNGGCKSDVRMCIHEYVLHWLTLRFYDTHPIHDLITSSLGHGPLLPLCSDLTCSSVTAIPLPFIKVYSQFTDNQWVGLIGYLERLDVIQWRESISACVFDKIHPASGNNVLQTLLKMEFTQSALVVLAWSSRISTQSNHVRETLLMRENLLGERALHLIAAQPSIELVPLTFFNEILIDTIMSVGIGRSALCGQSTRRGNLLHYTVLSGDCARIRLLLADMDVSLKDVLWDGKLSYELLAESRKSDVLPAVTRVLQTYTLQQAEWVDVDEGVYDLVSDDDSLAAEDDVTPNQSDEEPADE